MITHKKKRKHAGLKFIAALIAVGIVIIVASTTQDSALIQRLIGNREDRRVERTAVTPRFEFASATMQISIGEIYNDAGATVDLTSTRDISIDRQSSTAKSDVKIERTSTEVAPGVNALPFDALNSSFTEIITKTKRYESPLKPGNSWIAHPVEPYYYGTPIDPHYIPMVDDIMGYELRDIQSKPMITQPAAGLRSTIKPGLRSMLLTAVRPTVTGPAPPSAITSSYTYQIDLATFRRAVPILAIRAGLYGPPATPVILTVGFDDVGLLRYADVGMASSVASTLAQQLGANHTAVYHYTLSVSVISGEPMSIDVPKDVVDGPADGR